MATWADVGKVVSGRDGAQLGTLSALRRILKPEIVGNVLELGSDDGADRKTASLAEYANWEFVSAYEFGAAGGRLPYEDAFFDVVFVHHALERLMNPLDMLKEARRVLGDAGQALVAVNQFRPATNGVIWNITPLGMHDLAVAAGFEIRDMRAGIDGKTLLERVYLGNPKESARFFSDESPLNVEIEAALKAEGKGPRPINLKKLQFAGAFVAVLGHPAPAA